MGVLSKFTVFSLLGPPLVDRLSSILTALLCSLLLPNSVGDELVLRAHQKDNSKLLVLNSGRVIRGEMTPRPEGGYEVLQPGGRMFVAPHLVRFQATSLDDAWQKMRDSMTELTPDTHINLARWCLNNKLQAKAKAELLDALHLDPYRTEAKRMLEAIVRNETYEANKHIRVDMAEKLKQHREFGSMLPQRRSLGGLPGNLAKEFSRRVQPIVSNKCGNSGCHGAGRNDFVVQSISRGMTPVKSEQNLAAILNQIDYNTPLQSPILRAAEGLHGGASRPLFPGQTGRTQLETLRAWVVGAAEELAPTRPSSSVVPVQNIQQSSRIKTVSATSDDFYLSSDPDQTFRQTQAKQFVQKALVVTKHDAFDPDVFNQKHHGRSRHDVLPATTGSRQSESGDASQLYQNQAFQTDTSRKESR